MCGLSRFSCVGLFETPRVIDHQAPLSIEFSRQDYWSGLPFPIPGHIPDQGIKPTSLLSLALTSRFFTTWAIWEFPRWIFWWMQMQKFSTEYSQTKYNHMLKELYTMIVLDLFKEHKNGSMFANQSVRHTKVARGRIKIMWSSQQMRKMHLTKFNIHLWLKSWLKLLPNWV